MLNIRSFKKFISTTGEGDIFYLNAISASPKIIEYVKQLIKDGYITPDKDELNKTIKEEYHSRFLHGVALVPQMNYIVIRIPEV